MTDTDARAALVTSANLTGAGLFENLELGLVQYDPPVAARAIAWFDELWDEAAGVQGRVESSSLS